MTDKEKKKLTTIDIQEKLEKATSSFTTNIEKLELLKDIEQLKSTIKQYKIQLNNVKFGNLKSSIGTREKDDSVTTTEVQQRDIEYNALAETIKLKQDLHRFAGLYCSDKSETSYIFHLHSGPKFDKNELYAVEIIIENKVPRLGRWVMPMVVDLKDLWQQQEEQLSNKPFRIKDFMRSCKHYLECYTSRKEQYTKLKEFLSTTKTCFVETNLGYDIIDLKMYQLKKTDNTRESYDVMLHMYYKVDQARPNTLNIEPINLFISFPEQINQMLQTYFKAFKKIELLEAFKKITNNKSLFEWNQVVEDDFMELDDVHVVDDDQEDEILKSETSSASTELEEEERQEVTKKVTRSTRKRKRVTRSMTNQKKKKEIEKDKQKDKKQVQDRIKNKSDQRESIGKQQNTDDGKITRSTQKKLNFPVVEKSVIIGTRNNVSPDLSLTNNEAQNKDARKINSKNPMAVNVKHHSDNRSTEKAIQEADRSDSSAENDKEEKEKEADRRKTMNLSLNRSSYLLRSPRVVISVNKKTEHKQISGNKDIEKDAPSSPQTVEQAETEKEVTKVNDKQKGVRRQLPQVIGHIGLVSSTPMTIFKKTIKKNPAMGLISESDISDITTYHTGAGTVTDLHDQSIIHGQKVDNVENKNIKVDQETTKLHADDNDDEHDNETVNETVDKSNEKNAKLLKDLAEIQQEQTEKNVKKPKETKARRVSLRKKK